jgi:hypothetical protein
MVMQEGSVVLVGPVDTGETHLAIALGIACCQRERRVRDITAAELTNALVEAKQDGRLSRKLELLARFDVVVMDELGYVPFDKQGADLLFGFITRVYERRSLIVTTNLAFASWSEDFLDASAAAAVMDRVVHHATVRKTDGDSLPAQGRQGEGRTRQGSPGQVKHLVRSQCRAALGPRLSPSPVSPTPYAASGRGSFFGLPLGSFFMLPLPAELTSASPSPTAGRGRMHIAPHLRSSGRRCAASRSGHATPAPRPRRRGRMRGSSRGCHSSPRPPRARP